MNSYSINQAVKFLDPSKNGPVLAFEEPIDFIAENDVDGDGKLSEKEFYTVFDQIFSDFAL
jgi:hypothetical protein